jgi:hypothetical protein
MGVARVDWATALPNMKKLRIAMSRVDFFMKVGLF